MVSFSRSLFLMVILVFGVDALALTVRCDRKQVICEINTKRLVKGDYIGIFDLDGYLSAVGRVTKISGAKRTVKIKKKYGFISKSHKASLIKDREASNPRKYFKILESVHDSGYGFLAGLVSLGAGDGLSGFQVGGLAEFSINRNLFYVVRGSYISASGGVSYETDNLQSTTLTASIMSAMGGVAYWAAPNKPISLRTEVSLGLANTSLSTADGSDAKEVADGRLFPGMGLNFRAGADVVSKIGGTRYLLGAAFMKLQNSFSYVVQAGALFEF